jgi:hypothetical protein
MHNNPPTFTIKRYELRKENITLRKKKEGTR